MIIGQLLLEIAFIVVGVLLLFEFCVGMIQIVTFIIVFPYLWVKHGFKKAVDLIA